MGFRLSVNRCIQRSNMVKESLEELAHPEYWDKRYSSREEDKYDWLRTFSTIRPFLEKYLPEASTAPKILQLGCGNSVRQPYTDGQKHVNLMNILADCPRRHYQKTFMTSPTTTKRTSTSLPSSSKTCKPSIQKWTGKSWTCDT